MLSDRSRMFRKADLVYLTVILTLCGTVWAMIQKPIQWNEAAEKVREWSPKVAKWDQAEASAERIEPVVYETKNRMDVTEAHFNDIIRRLDRIERKVDGVQDTR